MSRTFPENSIAIDYKNSINLVYINTRRFSLEVLELFKLFKTPLQSKLEKLGDIANWFLTPQGTVIIAVDKFSYFETKTFFDKVFGDTKESFSLMYQADGSFWHGFIIYTSLDYSPFKVGQQQEFLNFLSNYPLDQLQSMNFPVSKIEFTMEKYLSMKTGETEFIISPNENYGKRIKEAVPLSAPLPTLKITTADSWSNTNKDMQTIILKIILEYLREYFENRCPIYSVLDLESTSCNHETTPFDKAICAVNTNSPYGALTWHYHASLTE